MDTCQKRRIVEIWKALDAVRVTEIAEGDSQMKQRRAATHDQLAILRIDDRQRAGEVRVQLDDVAANAEPPRLRLVRGRRKNRVAHEKPELRRGAASFE